MTGMAMNESVPVDDRVMVKNGNRCPGAERGNGQFWSGSDSVEWEVGAVDVDAEFEWRWWCLEDEEVVVVS